MPAPLILWSTLQCSWGLCPCWGCFPVTTQRCWALGPQVLGHLSVSIGSLCLATCGLGLARLSLYSQSTCRCPDLCLEQFP